MYLFYLNYKHVIVTLIININDILLKMHYNLTMHRGKTMILAELCIITK